MYFECVVIFINRPPSLKVENSQEQKQSSNMYLVSEPKLLELFTHCRKCGGQAQGHVCNKIGTYIEIEQVIFY